MMIYWMLVSCFISAITLEIAIRRRDAPKSRYFIILTLAITVYILGRIFESAATNMESAYFGVILSYIGLPFIPALMLLFLLDYHDVKVNKMPFLILFIPLLLTSIFVTVPELRHFYYESYYFVLGPPISQIVVEGTFYYYVMFQYHLFLNIACLALAIWGAVRHATKERMANIVVFIAVLLPMIAEVLYVARLTPMKLEVGPIALGISIALLCWAVYRLNLLRILPLAKDAILDQMSDAFIIVDSEKRFIEANETAKQQFHALSVIRVGEKIEIAEMFPEMRDDLGDRALVTVGKENAQKHYQLAEHVITHHSKRQCICYTLHDVTDIRKLMAELRSMATFDPMTKIFNHDSFYSIANHELDHATAQRTPVSALCIDIDNFRDINDNYGHFGGDEVIKVIVRIIVGSLRKADIFGRIGGDEFSILLPNTKQANAVIVAKKLQQMISEESISYKNKQIPTSISIGVAEYDFTNHNSVDDLLQDADQALHEAKNLGKSSVCAYGYEGLAL